MTATPDRCGALRSLPPCERQPEGSACGPATQVNCALLLRGPNRDNVRALLAAREARRLRPPAAARAAAAGADADAAGEIDGSGAPRPPEI
jgi:hypothetical protein